MRLPETKREEVLLVFSYVVLVSIFDDDGTFDECEAVLKLLADKKEKFSLERMIRPACFNPPAAFPNRA